MTFTYNDGGRAAAGYKGSTGDCVVRAVAIATQQPYQTVYDALAKGMGTQRKSKNDPTSHKSVRNGVSVRRKWFKEYLTKLGWTWTPTMGIGTGCKVHLVYDELPVGRLIVAVSKHYTAVIDRQIHDTGDPQRCITVIDRDVGQALKPGQWRNVNGVCSLQRRCVYGYWSHTGCHTAQSISATTGVH